MEATGVKFDAASFKSLTLANIFAMELHKYSSDVDEIVNAAVQEQKIETEVSHTLYLLQLQCVELAVIFVKHFI
jgi:hypothetical protein